MKIGIYAGTFDPIHKGHLEFAQAAIGQADLERVVIVAEKEPYRKKPHASWDHRQAMIERATSQLEHIDHDYQFANQLSHQHTMKDMLAAAQAHYGNHHEYWFLVGSDIFEHIGEWKNIIHHKEYGGFIIALKTNFDRKWLTKKIKTLQEQNFVINNHIIDHVFTYASSSAIRDAVAHGKQVDFELKQVVRYIESHQLYR